MDFDRFSAFSVENELKRLANTNQSDFGAPVHQEMLEKLLREIELAGYHVLCLAALYAPSAIQSDLVQRLFAAVGPLLPNSGSFSLPELTALTSLLLFVNPVRLQQQCDGSTDVFTQFSALLTNTKWAHSCVKAVIQLCFGVSLKYARNSLGLAVPHELNEYAFVEDGLAGMALEFIQAFIVNASDFAEYSFSVDVFDALIKNFICYFREKQVEMFNVCEEELFRLIELQENTTANATIPSSSRMMGGIEGKDTSFSGSSSSAPVSVRIEVNHELLHFKALLELIAVLYNGEHQKLVHCSRDFTNPKFEALYDFVQSCRAITAPPLAVVYLDMLRALCKTKQSARAFFQMLK